jgi:hypothetical protein
MISRIRNCFLALLARHCPSEASSGSRCGAACVIERFAFFLKHFIASPAEAAIAQQWCSVELAIQIKCNGL